MTTLMTAPPAGLTDLVADINVSSFPPRTLDAASTSPQILTSVLAYLGRIPTWDLSTDSGKIGRVLELDTDGQGPAVISRSTGLELGKIATILHVRKCCEGGPTRVVRR